MNKIVIIITLCMACVVSVSCNEEIVLKYQDKPQLIICEGIDKAIIHEALYSFQEDIASYYKSEDILKGTNEYYINGYRNFVQPGLSGRAPYATMVSKHTARVMQKLMKNDALWLAKSNVSHLNYNHPFIECLLENIKNEELRVKFESLKKVNYLSPEILAVPLRAEVNSIVGDPNLAMYVALDGYYQNLYDVDLNKILTHE